MTTFISQTQSNHSPVFTGRVVAFLGNQVWVAHLGDTTLPCFYKRNQLTPVVGDLVDYVVQGQQGVIETVHARENIFFKVDKKGKQKPLASNISRVFVVQASNQFSAFVLDRYLVALTLMGIPAVIVLNKMDLLSESEKPALQSQLDVYEKMAYPIIWASAREDHALQNLIHATQNQTSIFVGPSGVGKSSLIAKLSGESIATQSVSIKGVGKHTTTTTRLYDLKNGGYLIDAFGVREFKLWKLSRVELLHGFMEFVPYLEGCQYKNCRHHNEKGCQLLEAISKGLVSSLRYERFLELEKEYVDPNLKKLN